MAGPGIAGHGGAAPRPVESYSRLVRWMKIVLPVTALCLIAAVFLSARDRGDVTDLFTPDELARLGAGLKLENPRFSGVTEAGQLFSVQAEWALPDGVTPRVIDLEKPRGEIEFPNGRKLTAQAATGRMLRDRKTLVLVGDVVLDSSDGYHVETGRLEYDLDGETVVAPGRITGSGPQGVIIAGSMRAESGSRRGQDGKIWFENRVRLVFIPPRDAD